MRGMPHLRVDEATTAVGSASTAVAGHDQRGRVRLRPQTWTAREPCWRAGDAVEDIEAALRRVPDRRALRRSDGHRRPCCSVAPGGQPFGAIVFRRIEVGLHRQADRAAQDVRGSGGDRDRERAAVQGLQARNASSPRRWNSRRQPREILKVISSSPTDTQPVFDAIAESAAGFAERTFANVFRFDGQNCCIGSQQPQLRGRGVGAAANPLPDGAQRYRQISGRVALSKAVVHMPDALADPDFLASSLASRRPVAARMLWPCRCYEKVERDRRHRRGAPGGRTHSRTSRSRWSRRSPTRRSSPSRTCGCSRSWSSAMPT